MSNRVKQASTITMLYNVNLATKSFLGVKKKMLGQAKALSLLGEKVELLCLDRSKLVALTFYNGKSTGINPLQPSVPVGDYYTCLIPHIERIAQNSKAFYIRFSGIVDKQFVTCLDTIDLHKVPIFLDVPTYPYENELSSEQKIIDAAFKPELHGKFAAVFCVTPPDDVDEIFGSPCHPSFNGINTAEIPCSPSGWHHDSFNIIAMGWLAHWHGFDRVISGLSGFITRFPDVEITLHVVGDGNHRVKLEEYTVEERCERQVHFWGSRDGQELNEIFSRCQLGVGSLGMHRQFLTKGEPLKTREYIARGFPVVLSYEDPLLKNKLPGLFKVAANDSKIDLVDLYYLTKEYYLSDGPAIHSAYAASHFDWKIIMAKELQVMNHHFSAR